MYRQLQDINARPRPFEHYTAADLWTDGHTSSQMLACHLDGSVDLSSRRTDFIEASVRWILQRFSLDETKSVLDFGCGPGLYTNRLAACGARITGIDFSERSLRHARACADALELGVEYVHADYLEYDSRERFDLITMIMCDFCALSPSQRKTMLDRFRALLRPGGAILLDVYSLSAFDAREETVSYAPGLMGGFWSADPYYGFLNTFKYESAKVVLDKYTIVEERRTRVVYNWLQYFDRPTLTSEFEACGLAIVETLGDVAGAPFDAASSEFAVVAGRA